MRKTAGLLLLALLILLSGCQAIFTYSPLSGLKRDPANMTPAQRLTYAQDALASGDPATMKTAYDAIVNDTSGPAQYTAAQLGVELSGVPTVLRDLANNPSDVSNQLSTLDQFITSHGLQPAYMVAAAAQLTAAAAAGQTLTTMDYVMGSMGLMLGSAHAATGTYDVKPTTVNHTDAGTARTFLAPAMTNVASLSSGDPLRTLVQDYDNYLATF
jgi:hypothetical protein